MRDINEDGRVDWHDRYLQALSPVEAVSVKLGEWLFTPLSALLHTVWFVLWFALGLDINLLTLVVSLEAIYITLFIGLGQTLSARRDGIAQEQRDHLAAQMEALVVQNTKLTDEIHQTVVKDG